MNYTECVSYIHNFFKFNKKAGLSGITKLLEKFSNPQDRLKFIHIAGTNGKGSTTAMTANILASAGYNVGMFISPFVIDFRERFQVNNKMIQEDELCDIVNKIVPVVEELLKEDISIAQFEVVTLIGMLHFLNKKCDVVCLEVGIGGLYDATNIITNPLVAVICSISLDHTKILGETIEDIAFQKAGIIKDNSNVVCYPSLDVLALAVIMEQSAKKNATLHIANISSVTNINSTIFSNEFSYKNLNISMSLGGYYQIYNALTVIEIIEVLRQKGFNITDENIIKGIKTIYFPARLEKISNNPLIIIDGAHNIGGITALKDVLIDSKFDKKILIIATLKDKDYDKSLSIIAPYGDIIIATTIDSERALDVKTLQKFILEYNNNCIASENITQAITLAKSFATKDSIILVCGSLYLASEVLANKNTILE